MKKNVLLFLLVFFMLALPVFAGGRSASSSGDATELRIMIRNIGMASTNDNIINRELEKRTGLKLNWDLKPSEGYNQAFVTVIASGDYPDAVEFGGAYPVGLQELADDGVIRPVDDLVAKYGPEFTPAVRPANNWFVSTKDGKRYAIPTRTFDFGIVRGMLIRKDWMNMLGLQMPKNSDDYFNVLTAFAQNAERLVGPGKRLVPHGTGDYQNNMVDGCFLNYLRSENGMIREWNRVDGKLVHSVNMPAFKNVLLTARKFYQAGLIEPEFPIITSRDDMVNIIASKRYAAWDWYLDSIDEETAPLAAQIYAAAPELRNNLAIIPYFQDRTGNWRFTQTIDRSQMIIFNKTSEAKAINVVKLMNYIVSKDGFYLTELGIEGEHYTIDNSGRVKVKDMTIEERAKLGHWNYAWVAKRSYIPIAASDYVRNTMQNEFGLSHGIDSPLAYGKFWTQYGSALDSLRRQYQTELITRKDINFDAMYTEFVNTWNAQGGAQVTQEMNEMYR